jgi:hypothetical protein
MAAPPKKAQSLSKNQHRFGQRRGDTDVALHDLTLNQWRREMQYHRQSEKVGQSCRQAALNS